MDILTLISANIRRQKGAFISIVVLTLIIAMALTAILSIGKSTRASIDRAMETACTPDVTAVLATGEDEAQLIDDVERQSIVNRIELEDCVAVKCEINGTVVPSTWFLEKYNGERYPRVKDDLSGYADQSPAPKKGEIYVTQGTLSSMSSENCRIGDKILIYPNTASFEEYAVEMTIAGVVVEPAMGSAYIGIKQVFVSDEDFEAMYRIQAESGGNLRLARIYQSADSHLSSPRFRQQINLATGVIDRAIISIDHSMSVKATYFFPEIIFSFLAVFLMILTLIVMIVIYHSIVTSIEIDYVNLGVLKAMGVSRGKIRRMFFLQYLAAELLGAVLGFALAIPLIRLFGSVFQPITAIPARVTLAVVPAAAIMAGILALSGLFILLGTGKVGRIAPIRAIAGGREEIYFDSRLKAPVGKRCLGLSLALRQLTAHKRRYVAAVIIAALLTFSMLTITVLGDSLNSETALERMGQPNLQIHVNIRDANDLERFDEITGGIEGIIQRHTPIKKTLYMGQRYASLNGETLLCNIYKNPDSMLVSKGRAPLYDNEVAITPIVAEALEVHIGDKVTLAKEGRTECIITGFFNSIQDTGLTIAINLDCAKKIGIQHVSYAGYGVENITRLKVIQSEIIEDYGAAVNCDIEEKILPLPELFDVAILAIKVFIYALSAVFALVTVIMVCKKAFMQERIDIGVYKAMGFRADALRLQFALRFLLVALLGAVLGALLSLWISDDVLSLLLRTIGLTGFRVDFTAWTFAVPVVLLCLCFFLFAYLAARRVKAVDVRELITE